MQGSKARRHYPALDGIRGVAALAVVFAHFDGLFWINNGWIGVDIFFVLSGFLITRLLLADIEEYGTIRFGRFYWRRVLRLMPALVLMVVAFVGIELVLREHDIGEVLLAAGAALTYTTNWIRAVNAWDTIEFQHTWTLAVEEQFYLTLPLLLLVLTPLLGKVGRLAAIITLVLAVYVHRTDLIVEGVSWNWITFAFYTRCGGLLIGVAAALSADLARSHPHTSVGARALTAGALAGCAAIAVALIAPVPGVGYLLALEPFVAVGTALLLVHLLTAKNSLIERALSFPPLVGVGTVSYGLYLWHYPIWTVFWPAVAWLHTPAWLRQPVDLIVLLPVSLAVCTLSHRYVERPFLALRDRGALKTAEQPAATVAPLEA